MTKLKNNNLEACVRHRFLAVGLVFLILTAFALFLLVSVLTMFFSNPTVTSLESSVYPVSKVPFPGVALCNINKISRKRALNLAGYISNRTSLTGEQVMEYIRFLGFLYDFDYDRSYRNEIESFQQILDQLGMKISNLMASLVTPCQELLETCHWKGIEVNCSKIFFMRLTFDGYCCTFNYIKNTSDWWKRHGTANLEIEFGISGTTTGLTVMVRNDLDDYFYTTRASTGINVHVFIPTDYPDKSSGDLIESLSSVGSENFVEVIPTTVTAVKDVMNYPVNKRDCLFEVEQITQFGVYSQSDCFVDCRVRSMMTLCECIPFVIPISTHSTECTLMDLACLHKYQKKWTMLVPQHVEGQTLQEEEDALLCPSTCYPSCEATLYKVATSSVPIFDGRLRNHTSIHVFYGDRYHNLFLQDVVHYWFDMLSSVGGIFGLVMGLSVLSVVEGIIRAVKLIAGKW